jgi:hypothetical protein
MTILPFAIAVTSVAGVMPLRAQRPTNDTIPAAVVQRFVDAANARDLGAMVSTLAEGVVFGALPGAESIATGRDSVRAYYARLFARLPAGFTVRVTSRIADGSFVVDFEQFTDSAGSPNGQATWIYYVGGGQIQHAWSLRQPRTLRR